MQVNAVIRLHDNLSTTHVWTITLTNRRSMQLMDQTANDGPLCPTSHQSTPSWIRPTSDWGLRELSLNNRSVPRYICNLVRLTNCTQSSLKLTLLLQFMGDALHRKCNNTLEAVV